MNSTELISELSKYRNVVITGPQRSGTTFASAAIANNLSYTLHLEEDHGTHDVAKFRHLLEQPYTKVIQCPGLCHTVDEIITEDTIVVMMIRDIDDIIKSQERIYWNREQFNLNGFQFSEEEYEKLKYINRFSRIEYKGETLDITAPISVIKYAFWEAEQKHSIKYNIELKYESLKDIFPDTWKDKSKRTQFSSRQFQEISSPFYSQVFIDTGEGFKEETSIIYPIIGAEKKLTFNINTEGQVKGLRFDPINTFATMIVKGITIIDNDNVISCGYDGNYTEGANEELIFSDNDPNLKISGFPEGLNTFQLVIDLTYLFIGKDAYDYFVDKEYLLNSLKNVNISINQKLTLKESQHQSFEAIAQKLSESYLESKKHLHASLSSREEDINLLRSELQSVKNENTQLTEELHSGIVASKIASANLNSKIDFLKEHQSEKDGIIARLTEDKTNLSNQVGLVHDQLDENKREVKEKEENITKLLEELRLLERDKGNNLLEIQQKEQVLNSKNHELQLLNSKVSAIETDIREKEKQLSLKSKQIEKLNTIFVEQEQLISEAKRELEEKISENNAIRNHLNKIVDSSSYKVGFSVTSPARAVYDIVKTKKVKLELLPTHHKIHEQHINQDLLNKLNTKRSYTDVTEDNIDIVENPSEVILNIDYANQSASSSIALEGWILSDNKIDKIELYNDSEYIGKAKLNKVRLDVANSFPHRRNKEKAGFIINVNPAMFTTGLTLVATTITNRVIQRKITLEDKYSSGVIPINEYSSYTDKHPKYYRKGTTYPTNTTSALKAIAFYLPQYHAIKENNEHWGEGFTEWTNTTKILPKFEGHYQPRLPADLGYYNLSETSALEKQIALAKNYGIYGFCFHYYWFSGTKVLEKPLENLLNNPSIDFNFCINWANENWTKRWDGMDQDVILAQEYKEADIDAFYNEIKPIISDKRYIRVNDKPLILIYRPAIITNLKTWIQKIRKHAKADGIGELQICGCVSIETFDDYASYGLDAMVEFPPHHVATKNTTLQKIGYEITGEVLKNRYDLRYNGRVFDYKKLALSSYAKPTKPDLYNGVMLSWDNTARKQSNGTPFINTTPQRFKTWLRNAAETSADINGNKNPIFINAWNEWAEGTYLEPDRHYGHAYLEAFREVYTEYTDKSATTAYNYINKKTITKHADTAIILHLFYPDLWDQFRKQFKHMDRPFDIYISLIEKNAGFEKTILKDYPKANIFILPNRGRDVGPFVEIMNVIYPLKYKYICKVHSKKSPHAKNGHEWRDYIVESLFGSKKHVQKIFKEFEKNKNVGIILGKKSIFEYKKWGLGTNESHMAYLAALMNIESDYAELYNLCKQYKPDDLENFEDNKVNFSKNTSEYTLEDFVFPAGTMFWFRPEAIESVLRVGLHQEDFDMEMSQLDGTLAHGVERMIGLAARHHKYLIKGI